MKKMLFVGIDISADELVVAVERDGESLSGGHFDNSDPQAPETDPLADEIDGPVRVGLEATGSTGSLCPWRCPTKRVEVMVANPRAIKDLPAVPAAVEDRCRCG
jgi:transposase